LANYLGGQAEAMPLTFFPNPVEHAAKIRPASIYSSSVVEKKATKRSLGKEEPSPQLLRHDAVVLTG
jgi:hypothetical protein